MALNAPASCRQDMARLAGHRQLETHAQVHKRLARPSRGRGGLVLILRIVIHAILYITGDSLYGPRRRKHQAT